MKLYWYAILILIKKYILRQNSGEVIRCFAEKMGVVYIKLAQILAMQNIDNIFTEEDRQELSAICDHCTPIPFAKIEKILQREYGDEFAQIFQSIDQEPLGSASVSQVHRATLRDGSVVAIKIKRNDITKRIEHDVKQIRKLIHRFSKFVSFRNLFGGDKALECYLEWIYQETDFQHERQNFQRYKEFADSVNGKIKQVKTKIIAPELHLELCTPNVIVMEYIPYPTINRLELDVSNKSKISQAENDYIQLSFYALFNGLPVVFHGDPHGGNIYLDEAGNIGFLDMGLIFEFSAEETELTRELFLSAYSGNNDRMVDLVLTHSQFTTIDRAKLMSDMRAQIERMHHLPVAQFFVEMIGVFTQYNIAPPTFLFKMAKAFLALSGLNTITQNNTDVEKLLAQQVIKFYFNRTANNVFDVLSSGVKIIPNIINTSLRAGINDGITESLTEIINLTEKVQLATTSFSECAELIRQRV